MPGPPKDISPSALWLKVTQRPRPFELVDFPRKGEDGEPVGKVAIWVLTQEEQTAAAADALKTTRRLLKDQEKASGEDGEGYANVYGNLAACEILYRACRDPEDVKRPAFPSADLLRRELSVDEVGVLMASYHEVQATLGPIVSTMTEDEYKSWVETLARGVSAFPLGLLSSQARTELMLRLASDLWTSWTSNASPTSPAESTSSDTPESE